MVTRAANTIGELMTTDVVTVRPDQTVRVALEAMIRRDIGAVVVYEHETTVGIFTERDITRRLLDQPALLEVPVGGVMSSPVVTAGPEMRVEDVFALMNDRGIRRLPVLDHDRLVGIVTERDLLRWVAQVARE